MDKYKIAPKDKKFPAEFCENLPELKNCSEVSIIVVPEIHQWIISVTSNENLNADALKNFCADKYQADAEINFTLKEIVEPPKQDKPEKKSAAPKKSDSKKSDGDKLNGKIKGEISKIENLKEGDEKIIVEGVIGSDIEKVTYGYGVNLREFKSGSCAVSFSVVDDTDGIICKKFLLTMLKTD